MKQFFIIGFFLLSLSRAGESITGAMGLFFGKTIPEVAFDSTSVIHGEIQLLPARFLDSIPVSEYNQLRSVYAPLRKDLVPDFLQEDDADCQLIAQVDTTIRPYQLIRIMIVSDQKNLRMTVEKFAELGTILDKKYSHASSEWGRIYWGGKGFLEIKHCDNKIICDYYGSEYGRWFANEKSRLKKEEAQKLAAVIGQF